MELYTDLTNIDGLYISTSGGECRIGDDNFSDYTIHIGGLNIELNKSQTLELAQKLKEHLEINNNKI